MTGRPRIGGAEAAAATDGARREIAGGNILAVAGVGAIPAAGPAPAAGGAKISKARGCLVTRGPVNTHHHLFRALPAARDAAPFGGPRHPCAGPRRHRRPGSGMRAGPMPRGIPEPPAAGHRDPVAALVLRARSARAPSIARAAPLSATITRRRQAPID